MNLKGGGSIPSFEKFVDQKKPKTNIQFTAVAVYYLKKFMEVKTLGPSHIYTCYKEVKRKTPGNLIQNLYDVSSSKHGYIDIISIDNIGLPTRGESYVEHDLPIKTK